MLRHQPAQNACSITRLRVPESVDGVNLSTEQFAALLAIAVTKSMTSGSPVKCKG
jgi:hypothetical protein